MSYSSLATQYVPASVNNYTQGRNGYKICKFTPHHMAGVLSAEQCGKIFQNPAREASANYGIDSDGKIACYVDEENRAWTSGSYVNDSQAITVEVSNCEVGGDWKISDAAWDSLVKLAVDVCQRYNFRLTYDGTANGSLTKHSMFQATSCPGKYLGDRFQELADTVNKILDGENISTSSPAQPNQSIQEASAITKYAVGTVVCTCKLSTQANNGTVYDGDWEGTITKVYPGAEYPYLLNNGMGFTNDYGIDNDPHIPSVYKKEPAKTQSTGSVMNYIPSDFVYENATFTVTVNEGIYIMEAPSLYAKNTNITYDRGESVIYDGYVKREGYVWISWVSASTGTRRWMAAGELNSAGVNTTPYGTFK